MKARRNRAIAGLVVLGGLWMLSGGGAGCDGMLGIDGLDVGCALGEMQCSPGGIPQTCVEYGRWQDVAPCSAGEHCDPASGQCVTACTPGKKRCQKRSLQLCSEHGQWSTEEECDFDCVDGACKCDIATKPDCSKDNEPRKCVGGTWNAKQACIGKTCFAGDCIGTCAPLQKRCAGKLPQRCGPYGEWEDVGYCAQGSTCSGGDCIKECSGANFRCRDNKLESCEDSVWVVAEECSAMSMRCIEEQATCDGKCTIAFATECDGFVKWTCDASKHWQMTDCAATYQTCKNGSCVGVCSSNATPSCDGNAVRSCDENGSWHHADCGDLTCVDGSCEGVCGPSSARCEGANAHACDAKGQWKPISMCMAACVEGTCERPSCAGLEETCGSGQDQRCCLSRYVPGGMFERGNDPKAEATVGAFRLDEFEVTVGRFRRFVDDYETFTPTLTEDLGAHSGLPGSGWRMAWSANLPTTKAQLRAGLKCNPIRTWTDEAGSGENLPLDCLTWYEAFAFCIWDGGYLPTEAEWNFAAAGGAEQRELPWWKPGEATIPDLAHAAYNCMIPGPFNDSNCSFATIPPVGSRSPLGNGKYGHADLAGSMLEWTLDVHGPYPLGPNGAQCNECATLEGAPGAPRVIRGGAWNGDALSLHTTARAKAPPVERYFATGARCARGI